VTRSKTELRARAELPAAVYAAAGAGDLAYQRLRKLPEATARTLRTAGQTAAALRERLVSRELTAELSQMRVNARRRAEALAEKVARVHGARHPELAEVRRLVGELRTDMEQHLSKEERLLFPRIRELAGTGAMASFPCGSLSSPISVMLVEHDRAGELLARLRVVTDGYRTPPDACASYAACYESLAQIESDTHLHVHKENNLLFPAVLRLEEQAADARSCGSPA